MSALSWLKPNAKISLFHCESNPLLLTKKASGDDGQGKEQISLVDVCRQATPSTCNLNPLLFNGHLQTAWTTLKESVEIPVYYKRKIFEQEDALFAGQFAVDFVVPPYEQPVDEEATDAARKYTLPSGLPSRTALFSKDELESLPSDDSRPMLIALHGLTGGSHEVYLRSVLAPLVLQDRGWEACVINGRGCAQTKISTPVLFNARATWDVRQLVKWLRKSFPNRPLFGIGFSLGANILSNYLGEEGENCELKGAVVCSNPWNLDLSNSVLKQSWIGTEVYSSALGANLVRLFNEHADELSDHPLLKVADVQKVRYIYEFDRVVQCALWGYPTEGAYHRDASSTDSLLAIKIPFLSINAEDDPISVKEAIPYNEFQQTPYGVLLTTSWGGHLGWFEVGGSRWFVKPAADFLDLLATQVDLTVAPVQSKQPEKPVANGNGHKEVDQPNFHPMRRKLFWDTHQQ
ncbi:hydrolase, alpha/beta fold family protein [Talaromyces proteolyticus]|uniref:alcohol O-acetyltransferase n=1 Tax=Talaromyces proteolyticus TaxID=1131652 RepID=A0AAD4KFC0_9EURO|nr:hydrolase, alpha/beta fold family protein [Talaromyces proteolyticus]KAH8689620.1 hydrolase, alpha/beta fold family protein [Talaromyces proteolyticus]